MVFYQVSECHEETAGHQTKGVYMVLLMRLLAVLIVLARLPGHHLVVRVNTHIVQLINFVKFCHDA